MRRAVITLCALFAVVACNQPAAPPAVTTAPAAKKLGIRPDGDTEIKPDMSQVPPDLQKVYAHIDENIDAHVENSPEVDPPAEHLELRRGHSRVGGDGEGILRRARLPADARLRRRRHRVRHARQSRRLRQVRRGRGEDRADLLDVRHDADHAAGRVDVAAVRSEAGRAGSLQESADRPRRHEFKGPADGAAERVPRRSRPCTASCR